MTGVLVGFAIIGAIVLIGYILGRSRVLGPQAGVVLGRLAFFVLTPCLLFTVLGEADVHVLFSSVLVVSLVAAAAAGLVFALVARVVWHRDGAHTVIGTLASAYVNANNIGIPVALYVLGDAAFSAPVILFQVVLVAPIALTILDLQTGGGPSIGRILTQPLRNPIIAGSVLGVLVAVFDIPIPDAVIEPFRVIGAAAVPVVLLAFGMSLYGQRPLAPGTQRRDVLLASALKLVLMPLVAWLVARFAFGFDGHELFGLVVLAALPTGQNVFNYAQRYERGVLLSRDVVLVTTVLSVPVLVVIALLLAT